MIQFADRLPVSLGFAEALLLLPLAWLAYWLELRAGAGRRRATARAALLCLLVTGAALPEWGTTQAVSRVVVVDTSESVDARALADALRQTGLDQAEARGVAVLEVGSADGSDLSDGLKSAAGAVPDGGRLTLVSDGLATDKERALDAARALRNRGVALDTIEIRGPEVFDAAVVGVGLPESPRAGDPVTVDVDIVATDAGQGQLSVSRTDENGRLVATDERAIDITAGGGRHRFSLGAASGAVVSVVAELVATADAVTANNVAFGAVAVREPPKVLVIGDEVGALALAEALNQQAMEVTVSAPERSSPAEYAAWDALALVDQPADRLTTEQLIAIDNYVREGGGLLLSGGRQSFAAGGWTGTALADLAPIRLEPADEGGRERAALLIILDVSASMGAPEGPPTLSKLELAQEAAALALGGLASDDLAGIVTYSETAAWLRPLTEVGAATEAGDSSAIDTALSGVLASGATRILPALQLGLPVLAAADAETRHAVLLTDGQDTDPEPEALASAVREARAAGVSLTTIAIGIDADQALLARLASIGRGRSHVALDAGDLPRLTLEESRIVRGRSERNERFSPRLSAPHPILAGAELSQLPQLSGYQALQTQPGTEVVLEASSGHPLLTVWHVGLGRVAAWLSDTGDVWSRDWLGSRAASDFWGAVVRHLARESAQQRIEVEADIDGDSVTVVASAVGADGQPIDLGEATLVVTGTTSAGPATSGAGSPPASPATSGAGSPPAGPATHRATSRNAVHRMSQVGPGRYAATFATAPGAYAAAVTLHTPRGTLTGRGAFGVQGPSELRVLTGGPATLAALAEAGGGTLLAPSEVGPLGSQRRTVPLWPFLFVLAALIWLADVASQLGVRLPKARRSASAPAP